MKASMKVRELKAEIKTRIENYKKEAEFWKSKANGAEKVYIEAIKKHYQALSLIEEIEEN